MSYPTAESPILGRRVRIDWTALENAFENNAGGVHYYLHCKTGELGRLVGGRSEIVRARVEEDPECMLIDGVSARDQYRWLEAFVATVDDSGLRESLTRSIQGPGSFGRFKSVLSGEPEQLRRWRAFRKVRLRDTITRWFLAHGLIPVPRGQSSPGVIRESKRAVPSVREQLQSVADGLAPSDLRALTALAEFLHETRCSPAASPQPSIADAEQSGGSDP